MLRLAAFGAALIALVVGALWLRSDPEAGPSSAVLRAQGPEDTHAIHTGTDEIDVTAQVAKVATAPQVADVRAPDALPVSLMGDADLERQLAESMYAQTGGSVVDYLVTRGLARSDSELVVRKGFADVAACSFDALRTESAIQSVSYDAVLNAAEAILHDADGPEISALMDVRAVQARATPCLLNAVQQMGIPFPPVELLGR